jgi:hypothetical protein
MLRAGFEVVTAVTVKSAVLWVVAQRGHDFPDENVTKRKLRRL